MAEGIRTVLSRAAAWAEARLDGVDAEFHGICSDSRDVEPGVLFVALRGPNHDAHDYVAAAAASGAAAALVERLVDADISQLVVRDTRLALGLLSSGWRRELDLPLVAITGSNGKTTVKEMTAAILSRIGPVLATRGNLNNEIGVPLTLVRLESRHRTAVVEMGANHPGEIAYLSGLAAPDVALITNAAAAHLAGFGSIEGVARAKGEIYQGLRDGGTAVINADDPHAALWHRLAGGRRILTFGLEQEADVRARWTPAGFGSRMVMTLPSGELEIDLPLPGRHNVLNALAAAAAATATGADAAAIKSGLEDVAAVAGRLQRRDGRRGTTVIDDSYNANPGSVLSALEVLSGCGGRRYLVLGDMAELGSDAEARHAEVGAAARTSGIDGVFATGTLSRAAAEAFGAGGRHFPDQNTMLEAMEDLLGPDTTLLVKGSRSARMERVVAALAPEGEEL